MLRSTQSASRTPLYQLKITLRYSAPPIWRRVVVPANMPLSLFHEVIQIAMGWTNSHLHQFVAGRVFYGPSEPEFDDLGTKFLDEAKYSVSDLAPCLKSKFTYEYDFGDSWEHVILLEKVLPPDAPFEHPVCLAGANACPVEDCGGIYGYYNLLRALKNPKHEQHDEMSEWVGGSWDPEWFDLNATNAVLKQLKL